ncbi:hypothetical protein [Stenotrophomonas bentonitica]
MFCSRCGSGGTIGQAAGFATGPVAPQPAKLTITASNSSRDALLIVSIDLFLSLVGGISRQLDACYLFVIDRPRHLLSGQGFPTVGHLGLGGTESRAIAAP